MILNRTTYYTENIRLVTLDDGAFVYNSPKRSLGCAQTTMATQLNRCRE